MLELMHAALAIGAVGSVKHEPSSGLPIMAMPRTRTLSGRKDGRGRKKRDRQNKKRNRK
jgi:hypothetical protein